MHLFCSKNVNASLASFCLLVMPYIMLFFSHGYLLTNEACNLTALRPDFPATS